MQFQNVVQFPGIAKLPLGVGHVKGESVCGIVVGVVFVVVDVVVVVVGVVVVVEVVVVVVGAVVVVHDASSIAVHRKTTGSNTNPLGQYLKKC